MSERRAERLLCRATFGPRPGDLEALRAADPEAWLERQLDPGSLPDGELERRLGALPELQITPESLTRGLDAEREGLQAHLASHPMAAGSPMELGAGRLLIHRSHRVGTRVSSSRLVRAVHGERQLLEVMVDFWANHFSVYLLREPVGGLLPHYEAQVLRPHALGRFEDLLLAVARSPAMLFYLDGVRNTAPGPGRRGLNENYARELLELHTLGVDGGYTQEDVIEVARTLTGWGVRGEHDHSFAFRPALHLDGPRRLLGATVPGAGAEQGENLLRRLARHPSTARHVSRRLARRFVADDPPEALVARAARRFLETEGRIDEVLRGILLSPELVDPAHRKLKTPVELAASALRATGGETSGGEVLRFRLLALGELPYMSRSPDGFPDVAAEWLDPAAVVGRIRLAFEMAHGLGDGTRLGPALPSGAASARGLLPGGSPVEVAALSVAGPEFQWQ